MNTALNIASAALTAVAAQHGTRWARDNGVGSYDLTSQSAVVDMLTDSSFFSTSRPADPELLAQHIVAAVDAAGVDDEIEGDEAAIEISEAITSLADTLGIELFDRG